MKQFNLLWNYLNTCQFVFIDRVENLPEMMKSSVKKLNGPVWMVYIIIIILDLLSCPAGYTVNEQKYFGDFTLSIKQVIIFT